MSALWDPIFGASAVAAVTDDRAWIQALCDVEAALARACAQVGVIPADDAGAIADACSVLASVDPAELGGLSASDGNPVIPLVRLLRQHLAANPSAASAVHRGATSQDIMDTAAMLVTRAALAVISVPLQAAADAVAELAAAHRDTAMVARTLLQQAVPTTFGAVAAGWGAGLDRASAELHDVRAHGLAVQLGGAGGTLASLYPHGIDVRAALATELALLDPGAVWHTERTRIARIAGALGTVAGTVAKVATDIVLLAQTEVGEVSEARGGGSSAMPHKQNPIAAVTARAGAAQAPGLVATLLGAMAGEHQRAAGVWHGEWQPLTALLRATGGASARLAESVSGLVVHPDAMRRNLDLTGGKLSAERVSDALTGRLGRPQAQRVVQAAAGDSAGFRAALLADPGAGLDPDQVDGLLDPTTGLGHAQDLVDVYLKNRAYLKSREDP